MFGKPGKRKVLISLRQGQIPLTDSTTVVSSTLSCGKTLLEMQDRLHERMWNNVNEKNTINFDELSNEVELVKEFWNGNLGDWKKKERDEEVKISEEKWKQLFNHFSENKIYVPNLGRVFNNTYFGYQIYQHLWKG